MTDVQTLLPPNATARETAIEGADAAIGDLDVAQIITARDVATCPAAILPYLAWERSVKVWDSAWPVPVQRAVVDAAPEVNRHIGTPYAVKTALAALGVTATLSEWWQASPHGVPYTFAVAAKIGVPLYGGAPLLDTRLIKVVFATVLHTKPLSRAFALTLAADMPGTLGLAPATIARTRVGTRLQPGNARDVASTLGLAPVTIARTRVGTCLQPGNARDVAATLGLAPATIARIRVAVSFNFAS